MRCIPFNTGWEYRERVSPFEEGFRESREWSAVHLPHDALIGEERAPANGPASGYFPRSAFEYRRQLDAPAEWADRCVYLRFEGVHRGALVYVNDQLAASRPYGYSEFLVRLDPYLRFDDENRIEVQAISGSDSRWYTGAGIYREVALVVGSAVHVPLDGLAVQTASVDPERAVLSVEVELVNDTRNTLEVDVCTQVIDRDGTVVASGSGPATLERMGSSKARHRLLVPQPRLWDLTDPHLYTVQARLLVDGSEVDVAESTFGIRSLELDPERGLRLNGRTVKLRGTCLHHDNGVLGAASIRRAEHRRVEILKSAGFNAIRSAHQPASRALLEACDRLGVLVMDESFDVWTRSKSNDDYARSFGEWWEADLEAMVRKDRNHPSVVMYSIGNEIQDTGTPLGSAIGRAMANRLHELDPTRYTTNCVNALLTVGPSLFAQIGASSGAEASERPDDRGVNTQLTVWRDIIPGLLQLPVVAERTAESFAAVDVAGYNYMDSRYDMDRELYPNRVIVGSETFPTEIGRNWPAIVGLPHVIGDFTWIGWDYLGETGVGRTEYADQPETERTGQFMGPFPWIIAGSGDITITGARRAASYFREIVFGQREEPYIAVQRPEHSGVDITYTGPWSWPDVVASWTWPQAHDVTLRVEVYSGSDEVELVLNGRSLGRKASGPTREFLTTFDVPYVPGELEAIAYQSGREVARGSLRSDSGDARFVAECDRPTIAADDGDLAFVKVALVDVDGQPRPGIDRDVSVTIDGPATLAGFGSGDPTPRRSFLESTQRTYDGEALAVIRPTGAGSVTLTFEAEGYDPVTVPLQVTSSDGKES
jgi:beta-galactosidase